jgi:hypothetical protein
MHVKAIETFETKAIRPPSLVLLFCSLPLPSVVDPLDPFRPPTCRPRTPPLDCQGEGDGAQIGVELKDLQATHSNIQDARSFEDRTVRFLLCYSPPPVAFVVQT